MSVDTLSLKGKVAIVTGAGKETGIGAAIATAFARNGASVAINYVSESSKPRAAEVVKRLENFGGKAVAVQADVSTVEGAKTLVGKTLENFGTTAIDIIVNNAGIVSNDPSFTVNVDVVKRVFAVNYFGPLNMIQQTVPHMPRGGRIVNIGTIASKIGWEADPTYAASKAAMDHLTLSVSKELGTKHGLTINVVGPGGTVTDNFPDIPENPGREAVLGMGRAERRLGQPEDVADIVLLVVSEKSRWLTGQHISASGGAVLG